MNPIGPAHLLARRVAHDPARPFITFYDDATGERIELSADTFDNWVAKTANFLVDGLSAEPGTPVVLLLPPHWQSAVWLMACWSAGMVAVPAELDAGIGNEDGEPFGVPGPYVLVSAEEVLDRVVTDQDAEEIVGLSLHALGGGLAGGGPGGVVDYAVEVRGYGDRFVPGFGVKPEMPALSVKKTTLTGARLAEEARGAVEKWHLDARDRVLVDMAFTTLEGILAGLLAPLASGASVIIQRNFAKPSLDQRLTMEHVTAVAGVPGWNATTGPVRRLL